MPDTKEVAEQKKQIYCDFCGCSNEKAAILSFEKNGKTFNKCWNCVLSATWNKLQEEFTQKD